MKKVSKFLVSVAIGVGVYAGFKYLSEDTFFWGWVGSVVFTVVLSLKDSIVDYFSAEKETEKE